MAYLSSQFLLILLTSLVALIAAGHFGLGYVLSKAGI